MAEALDKLASVDGGKQAAPVDGGKQAAPVASGKQAAPVASGKQAAPVASGKQESLRKAEAPSDPFIRAENEDDDGYDPFSDRLPEPEPLFERDPWA